MIARADIKAPGAFQNYINKAGSEDMMTALEQNTKKFRKFLKSLPSKKIDYAYAEGKWTIKQLLQHIIDAERVFSLRAVWFARKDPSPQPGFDENLWAENAPVADRDWKDMVEEFFSLRDANTRLFASLSENQLLTEGSANGNMLTPAAFGFITAGHVQHHIDIINERYLGGSSKDDQKKKSPKEKSGKTKDKKNKKKK